MSASLGKRPWPTRLPDPVSSGWTRRRHYSLVLGLESSCDDTCASVVASDRRILSNVVIRSDRHRRYRGIHPIAAVQGHEETMPVAIRRALDEAKCHVQDVDAFAYTQGPGFRTCLSVCSNAAKALAASLGRPAIGVHHMQAHALTPLLTEERPPEFPFLTLLVSGGHTLLLLARSVSRFEILADTRDDAVGNTIDRAARLLELDLSSPGSRHVAPGAALEALALTSPPVEDRTRLPRPNVPPSAFSFSGLSAAFARSAPVLPKEVAARSLLEGVSDHIVAKAGYWMTELARRGDPVTALVASGGVASNSILRTRLADMLEAGEGRARLVCPPVELCTDNAAMIAWVGQLKLSRGLATPFSAPTMAKWSIEQCEDLDVVHA